MTSCIARLVIKHLYYAENTNNKALHNSYRAYEFIMLVYLGYICSLPSHHYFQLQFLFLQDLSVMRPSSPLLVFSGGWSFLLVSAALHLYWLKLPKQRKYLKLDFTNLYRNIFLIFFEKPQNMLTSYLKTITRLQAMV